MIGSLPNELLILIATFLEPSSLVRLERVSRRWQTLLHSADARCWAHHAGPGADSSASLSTFLQARSDNCIDSQYWSDVRTWKEMTHRKVALAWNWTSDLPRVETSIFGYRPIDPVRAQTPAPITRSRSTGRPLDVVHASPASSYVWRARLDTAQDAQFVVTTWLSGGVRVIDARPESGGAILWELPRWSVRPYAHLEYREGVACWDSEQGIEIWKRWKLTQGDDQVQQSEPANKRGTFVRVGTIPDLPGMRGFMLNEALHLTVVSQAGRSCTYNVGADTPTPVYNFAIKSGGSWVYDFPIQRGATGHIEHDLENVVFCMGHEGYAIYHKASAKHLGDIKFTSGPLTSALARCEATNVMTVDTSTELPVRHEDTIFLPAKIQPKTTEDHYADWSRIPPARSRKPHLMQDEWGAVMIRTLDDGATMLVARSMGGRFMICTDLLGLLTCIDQETQEMIDIKVHQCLAIVECGGTRCLTEFHTGGWLTVHDGRAAWEIEDRVYIFDLPNRRDTIPNTNTHVMTLNGRYNGEISMPSIQVPVSIMSLHDDCLLTTYLHPAYIHVGEDVGTARWETSVLKSVRLIRFAPKALEAIQARSSGTDESGSGNERVPLGPSLGQRDLAMHQQWYVTSQLMAGHGINLDEDQELWAAFDDEAEAEEGQTDDETIL